MSTVMYQDDSVSLHIERHPDLGLVFHCRVHDDWTASLYKKCLSIWDDVVFVIKDIFPNAEYVFAACPDKKVEKFASKFGFYPINVAASLSNNKTARVMRYELCQQK